MTNSIWITLNHQQKLLKKQRFSLNILIIVRQLADISTIFSGHLQGSSEVRSPTLTMTRAFVETSASCLMIIKFTENLRLTIIIIIAATEKDVNTQFVVIIAVSDMHYITDSCQDGDVRLVGGQSAYEGRVEVCLSQRWGTVTDDGWSTVDVQVACKQLGYSTQGKFTMMHN